MGAFPRLLLIFLSLGCLGGCVGTVYKLDPNSTLPRCFATTPASIGRVRFEIYKDAGVMAYYRSGPYPYQTAAGKIIASSTKPGVPDVMVLGGFRENFIIQRNPESREQTLFIVRSPEGEQRETDFLPP
ncbi:MAG TPA: hypothetical protein VGH90_13530, partial [Chthoniobacteraceae bacterium]